MKKNIIYIFSVLMVVLGLFSCADLDLPSDGRVTLNDIFNHYQRTRNYWSSCRAYVPQVGLTYDNTPLASFCDEAHDASDNAESSANEWYNGRTTPLYNPITARSPFDPWNHFFAGIRKCNTFLACINDPSMATYDFREDEKNGWIAEVHVMRAFYYLQLIKRYGGVTIIDAPYEVSHDFSTVTRATFEECVDFIIADCDFALATRETEGQAIGFRWTLNDNERGQLTRGFAYAVKSQAALYAASPLWYTSGSKYTWEKATEITKEALDQCLAHGFQLYNTAVASDVAQSPYAYYFIQRSDPSRSVDKETIYETTTSRTNVWRLAGTPITEGMQKAGAGPSQELVDCYEMADGTQPILGYSDANHLQPILNPASSYDPANPYENRDPRFYASIYYNNSPRALLGNPTFTDYPLSFVAPINNMTMEDHDDYVTLTMTGGDPWVWTTKLESDLEPGTPYIKFEYISDRDINDMEFFYCVAGGPAGGIESGPNIRVPQADDWTEFAYDLTGDIAKFGFGKAGHFLRFDPTNGANGTISIRNFRVQSYNAPPEPTPVETFVDGNCGISDRVTDTRFTRTGYYLRKFNNYRSNANVDADGLMKIFRLGELYLNFAEAACQAHGADAPVNSTVGGSSLSAREAVNTVRARAEMPPLPAGMSKEDFEKRYRNERRVELAFEEHRFFDVRRWKILGETDEFVTAMRITKDEDNRYTYTRVKLATRGTNADKYLMFPLNQLEVTKMNAATGVNWQNPGW